MLEPVGDWTTWMAGTSLTQLCPGLGRFLGTVQHDLSQGRHGSRCPVPLTGVPTGKMIQLVIFPEGKIKWNMPKLSKGPTGRILDLFDREGQFQLQNIYQYSREKRTLNYKFRRKCWQFLRLCASFSTRLQRSDHSDKSTLQPSIMDAMAVLRLNIQIRK